MSSWSPTATSRRIGRPLVADASVSAEVVNQTRGPKLISFKYRPKARSRVKKGHRQELTTLRIADITFGGKSAAKDAKQAEDKARTERVRLEEAAAAQAAKDAELAAKLAADKPVKAEPKAKATATKAPSEGQGGAEGQGGRQDDRDQDRGPEEDDCQGRHRRHSDEGEGSAQEAPRHEEGRVDQMAHKKAGGSVKNGRDSVGQRLGVKAGDGQLVNAGSIIVRQRGMTFLAGPGTGLGHDYTVFATVTGKVKFEHATKTKKRIRVEAVETTAASA